MARVNMTPTRGVDFGTVIANISSRRSPNAEPADVTSRLASAILAGLENKISSGDWLAPAPAAANAGPIDQAVGALAKLRQLDYVERQHLDKRAEAALERQDKLERELAEARQNSMAGMVEFMKLIMDAQAKSEERVNRILEKMTETQQNMIKELKESGKKENLLEQIGLQAIQGAFKRDIKQELLQAKELVDALGYKQGVDPALFSTQLQYDLERLKLEHQKELDLKAQERSAQMSAFLAQVLGSIPKNAPPPGTGATVPVPPGTGPFRYQCGACGEEFLLKKQVDTAHCPNCGATIVTGGNGHAAQVTRVDSSLAEAESPDTAATDLVQ